MEFDPFNILGNQVISRVKLYDLEIDPNQVDIRIENEKVILNCEQFGAKMRGHSSKIKKGLFGKETEERFNFLGTIEQGGLSMHLEFVMDHLTTLMELQKKLIMKIVK